MKLLFLDESGDHNLSVIDPQYPFYVLGKSMKEDFEIVKSKLRRSRDGKVEEYGLVVLPRK